MFQKITKIMILKTKNDKKFLECTFPAILLTIPRLLSREAGVNVLPLILQRYDYFFKLVAHIPAFCIFQSLNPAF